MATQAKILETLRQAPKEALSPAELAEILHEKVSENQSQLERLEKDKKLIKKNEDGTYSLTEGGIERAGLITLESAQLLPSQQFQKIGVQLGIKDELSDLITEHVFGCCSDYRDLVQVWKFLNEMSAGIMPSLITMWFNRWRGVCNVPLPPELEGKLTGGSDSAEKKAAGEKKSDGKEGSAKEGGTGLRDYVLDENDNPVRVSVEDGSMTYEDANRLSNNRAIRGKSGGGKSNSEGGGQSNIKEMADAFKTMFDIVNGGGGGKKTGRMFLTHQDENGQMVVEEIEDTSKPTVIPQGSGPAPQDTLVVHEDGTSENIPANRPIIITPRPAKKEGADEPKVKYMVFDPATRQMKPWDGVSAIELGTGNSGGQGGLLPSAGERLPATLEGQPVPGGVTLDGFIKLVQNKQKMEQEAENHDMHIGLAKDIRELARKGARALAHMAQEEEDEDQEEAK